MDLVRVKELSVHFHHEEQKKTVVRGITFSVTTGECVGLVGESGSGKSTAMMALMGLLPHSAETVCRELWIGSEQIQLPAGDKDSIRSYEKQMRNIRGKEMAIIFQDPSACLNPSRKIGRQITETIIQHRICGYQWAKEEAVRLLGEVGINNPRRRFNQYPFELSGGMKQRVVIAVALACKPKLLIADEPTTALDTAVQKQILELLHKLAGDYGMSILLVTHDLGVAAAVCNRVMVMRAGEIVETGGLPELFLAPGTVYTRMLLACSSMPVGEPVKLAQGNCLVEVKQLTKLFESRRFLFGEEEQAVRGVSFEIREGEVFGVVGESGSGKTTLARMLTGLHRPTSGKLLYRKTPWEGMDKTTRAEIQMIFQHSLDSFNPRFTVRQVLEEALLYQTGCSEGEREERIRSMLVQVGLDEDSLDKYPAQFSGGQQQRLGIARALISNPRLVICDEPVSSLDVMSRMQILKLLKKIQRQQQSYLFISHDLQVIRYISQRVGVMFLGGLVEIGDTQEVYRDPWHPYTRELLQALLLPEPGKAVTERRIREPGETVSERRIREREEPHLAEADGGCPYYLRCEYKMEECRIDKPDTYRIGNREVACFLFSEGYIQTHPDERTDCI